MIEVTAENYYSQEVNMQYMSVSMYKEFMGTYGREGCQAKAMAELRGEYSEEPSTAMLVGSYVDAYFEGTLNRFKAEHPEILRKDGGLRIDYVKADEIIERLERDKVFMNAMSGEKQVIMTGEIGGVPWKIKIDSYLVDQAIVDLKIIKSFNERLYAKGISDSLNFAYYWGYDIQGAVYQEIVRQNTGKVLPFYLAVGTKEDGCDLDLFYIDPPYMKSALESVVHNLPEVVRIWKGTQAPRRCNNCRYCRMTKVLTGYRPISALDEHWMEA